MRIRKSFMYIVVLIFMLVISNSFNLKAETADSTAASIKVLSRYPGEELNTPVKADYIDDSVFSQLVDGEEMPMENKIKSTDLLCTRKSMGTFRGIVFGSSRQPGKRHIRIGFTNEIPVGTVLVAGNVSVSVLKPDVAYPGDMSDENGWLPAQRFDNGSLVTLDGKENSYEFWILPPGTKSRALRFTHTAKITDNNYAGKIKGVMVLPDRMSNLAPSASVASSISKNTERINNKSYDSWGAWENYPKRQVPEDSPVLSEEHPEWIVLSWQEPVVLNGLVTLWSGMSAVEVETYIGKGVPNAKSKNPADWKSMGIFKGITEAYPWVFWPNRINFEQPITTKAIRMKIIEQHKSGGHSHIDYGAGKRTWLGELMALHSWGDKALEEKEKSADVEIPPPPIPIHFDLEKDAYVTLVIENEKGVRVRNLVSETFFSKGKNTVYWDGTDDIMVDSDAAKHGLYRIIKKYVEPGEYTVRGLMRDAIVPYYEFSVYTSGNPPWKTLDGTGAWLANHSAPQAAVFVPAKSSLSGTPVVYLGCYVTEGPDGLAWVDIKDGKKLGGKKWIGGVWTAAPFMAYDSGPEAVDDVIVYVGAAWETGKKSGEGVLRLNAITKNGDKNVLDYKFGEISGKRFESFIGGIAVYNGVLVASMPELNQLLFVDAKNNKLMGILPFEFPQGVAFNSQGQLLVLSENQLLKFSSIENIDNLPKPQVVVSDLEDPKGITLDSEGSIYISDHGTSHQVKVYSDNGKLLKIIGNPGVPSSGPYDTMHMNHPAGLAVDSLNQIWVAENNPLPKRVSVWSQDGKLIKAFYGPAKYGGGGALDPKDKTLFYYGDETKGSLEFKLDWKKGTYEPKSVLYRSSEKKFTLPRRVAAPETALYHNGRRYFTDVYNSSPVGGISSAVLFADKNGVASPVAAMGDASTWNVLKSEEFAHLVPEGTDWSSRYPEKKQILFIWSDLNGDEDFQPAEVTFHAVRPSGVTIMPDLSFVIARLGDETVRFSPVSYNSEGVPIYDYNQKQILANKVMPPGSSGGDQALVFPNGWLAVTLGMEPFSRFSVSGAKDGIPMWSYPSPWPGLHASHRAPRPDRPGQLIGTTRLLGGFFEVKDSDAGNLWALHSNHGMFYIFTHDGLFVATLFKDMRSGASWRMPSAKRNMNLSNLTLGEENFWPTISATSDGNVYLVDGARSAIVRLDGLDSIKRLPKSTLKVTKKELDMCREWQVMAESLRQNDTIQEVLQVGILKSSPVVDGDLKEWKSADWVDIDKRGVKANFNSNSKPYNILGAMTVSGDKLYVAWQTGMPKLLENSGEMPIALFKTGGALDLMIATDAKASVDRAQPVAGDQRLLVTLVDKKPKALLYRAVVPGTPEDEKVPFSSPWRTITMDRVDDVTDLITFAQKDGDYEVSIPLSVLGLKPSEGMKVKGDIGVLRGSIGETKARSYWHNKATSIVSDVPDEAMLTPKLWGTLEFLNE